MAEAPPLDPFDDALADLRISGTVLLHCAYLAPWGVDVPAEPELRRLLQTPADARVLVFHHVRAGGLSLGLDGAPPVALALHDLALVTGGAAHRLSGGECQQAVPLARILAGDGPPPLPHGTPGATELICGVFVAQPTPLNPLLSPQLGALGPLLHLQGGPSGPSSAASPVLAGVVQLLAHELQGGRLGGYSVARLLELMCAETLKAHRDSATAAAAAASLTPGWLRGLADPRVGPALRHIHASPGQAWSVERLAGEVALSPSRFAARFREAVGLSVMAYLAAWRANIACRLLAQGELPLDEIARRVGFESLPAFSRAFKAQIGQPPGAWRVGSRGL